LSFQFSYHGLGPGASAFSGLAANFNACGPLLPDVHFLPVEGGWAANVSRALDELGPERTSAVIVEPQMGSRGFVPEPDDLVAAAAGLAVLRVYERDGILEHVRSVGAFLQERLRALHAETIGSGDVQGAGLMQLFPLVDAEGKPWPPPKLDQLRLACEDHGLLLSIALSGLWIVPPLISTESDCVEIVEALEAALADVRGAGAEAVGAGSTQEARS